MIDLIGPRLDKISEVHTLGSQKTKTPQLFSRGVKRKKRDQPLVVFFFSDSFSFGTPNKERRKRAKPTATPCSIPSLISFLVLSRFSGERALSSLFTTGSMVFLQNLRRENDTRTTRIVPGNSAFQKTN